MLDIIFKPQKVLFILFVFIIFVHAAITISYAKVVEFITAYITGKVIVSFQNLILLCLLFALATALINVAGGYIKGRVITGAMRNLRGRIFHTLLLNPIWGNTMTVGSNVSYLTNKLDLVESEYVGSFVTAVSLVFQFILALGLGLSIDSRLTLLVLFLEIPAICLPLLSQKYLKKVKDPVLQALDEYTADVTNWLSGINIIKNFNREFEFEQLHQKKALKINIVQNKDILVRKIVTGGSQFLGDVVYLGMWIVGGYFVIHKSLSFAAFIGFTQLSVSISYPLEDAANVLSDYIGGHRVFEHFEQVLSKKTVSHQIKASSTKPLADSYFLEYKDASIGSNPLSPILSNLNLKISITDKVVIIGASGSGKSTLVNTLFGYHPISKGYISVSGFNISEMPADYVSKIIGFEEQNTFMFNGSIKENLTMFSDKYSKRDLENVLKTVGLNDKNNIDDFLEAKVDTFGSFLSGGERKRLGLARNLLTGKRFMIFDELSSGLETTDYKSLEKMLFKLDIGFIYITHNYDQELLTMADKVYQVAEGHVQQLKC